MSPELSKDLRRIRNLTGNIPDPILLEMGSQIAQHLTDYLRGMHTIDSRNLLIDRVLTGALLSGGHEREVARYLAKQFPEIPMSISYLIKHLDPYNYITHEKPVSMEEVTLLDFSSYKINPKFICTQ